MAAQELIAKWLPGGPHDTIYWEPQSYTTARRDIMTIALIADTALKALQCRAPPDCIPCSSSEYDEKWWCLSCQAWAQIDRIAEGNESDETQSK